MNSPASQAKNASLASGSWVQLCLRHPLEGILWRVWWP